MIRIKENNDGTFVVWVHENDPMTLTREEFDVFLENNQLELNNIIYKEIFI